VPNGRTGQVSSTDSSFVLSSGGAAASLFVNDTREVEVTLGCFIGEAE
jgi:hypothetical protein